jgi:hypothetical protein
MNNKPIKIKTNFTTSQKPAASAQCQMFTLGNLPVCPCAFVANDHQVSGIGPPKFFLAYSIH